MRHTYSPENLHHWFKRLVKLQDKGLINWQHFDEFQTAKVEEYNDRRPRGAMKRRPLGKTAYYKLKSLESAGALEPEALMKAFSDAGFSALREYLLVNDPGLSSGPSREDTDRLSTLMARLLDVSPGDQNAALAELPGSYLTFRPSLSRPGWVVVGYLEIQRTKDDELVTDEFTIYRGSDDEPVTRQDFTGFIVYSHQFYLLTSSDSNSQFARISILRSSEISRGIVRKFDGLYCGASQRPGRSIFASRLHVRRVEDAASARARIGYKNIESKKSSESIDREIWDSLMMGVKSGILDF